MRSSEAKGDSIRVQDLELQVRIGVSDEERAQPQPLTLSITLWPATGFHEVGDEIARAVNYAEVVREVKEFVCARMDKLIETLAENIAAHLLRTFPLHKVQLELRKFILPEVKYVAVILTREQSPRA